MKKSITRSNSLKNQNTARISLLQNKLFSKLEQIQTGPVSKYEDLDINLLNAPDALSDLIHKAKGITFENQDKIKKAKRELRVSKKNVGGAFLTDTGLYTAQVQQQVEPTPRQPQPEVDHEEMLRNLTKKGEYDDLAELRRMIKITDENLGGYRRQVHQIKKQVINAATQFKSQMNFDLSYKLNKLEQPLVRKSTSMVKIRGTRYL